MYLPILTLTLLALTSFGGIGTTPSQDPSPLRPAPQHDVLFQRVGTWDAVLVASCGDGKPVESKGTLTVRKHAGLHTVDEYEGELLGLPFTGLGLNSWCPLRKQFLSTWTDSMTPVPLLLRGDYDAAKRELVMRGECYGRSGKLEPCRMVTAFQDGEHFACVLLGPGPDGKEAELVRVSYTRRK